MEQIEEWNEYGELPMEVENFDGFGSSLSSAASAPPPPSTTPSNPPATTVPINENAPPKQSTIKIQSPPSKIENKSDPKNLEALRQSGEAAAAKAKENTRARLGITTESKKDAGSSGTSTSVGTEQTTTTTTTSPTKAATTVDEHKESQIKSATGSEQNASKTERPSTLSEEAVQSTDDIKTNTAQLSDAVEHHRTPNVPVTSPGEHEKLSSDITKSISEEPGSTEGSSKEESGIKRMQSEAKQDRAEVVSTVTEGLHKTTLTEHPEAGNTNSIESKDVQKEYQEGETKKENTSGKD